MLNLKAWKIAAQRRQQRRAVSGQRFMSRSTPQRARQMQKQHQTAHRHAQGLQKTACCSLRQMEFHQEPAHSSSARSDACSTGARAMCHPMIIAAVHHLDLFEPLFAHSQHRCSSGRRRAGTRRSKSSPGLRLAAGACPFSGRQEQDGVSFCSHVTEAAEARTAFLSDATMSWMVFSLQFSLQA